MLYYVVNARKLTGTRRIGFLAMDAREFLRTDVIVLAIVIYAGIGVPLCCAPSPGWTRPMPAASALADRALVMRNGIIVRAFAVPPSARTHRGDAHALALRATLLDELGVQV
jgi:hypothetical protein